MKSYFLTRELSLIKGLQNVPGLHVIVFEGIPVHFNLGADCKRLIDLSD